MQRITPVFCALVLVTLARSHFAEARPFPRRGYIVQGVATATVGRRASVDAAQRAAMRMLSRLTRWYPHETLFNISWQTLSTRGKVEEEILVFNCDSETSQQELHGDKTIYSGVTKGIIRKVARRNGKCHDVTRYGAVDILHPVRIDLGTRASYDAGRSATMRVLARRLQSPFAAEYEISWKYRRREPQPDQRLAEVTVNYSPTYHGSFIVHHLIRDNPAYVLYADRKETTLVVLEEVSREAVKAVGRRSGTFKDLKRYGAQGYSKEKQCE